MNNETKPQSDFLTLIQDSLEIIAFGFSGESKPVHTIRDSITNPDPEVVAECVEVWGADFGTICQALIALNVDLDREYVAEMLF